MNREHLNNFSFLSRNTYFVHINEVLVRFENTDHPEPVPSPHKSMMNASVTCKFDRIIGIYIETITQITVISLHPIMLAYFLCSGVPM